MYDIFDRLHITGVILMGLSIFLLLVVVLSNIGLYKNISTDLQGSNGGFMLITSVGNFLFGALMYYAGKGGISESEALEQKRQSEKKELLHLRNRVQELEIKT